MPRRPMILLALLALTGCATGGTDQPARIAELESEVAELEAEVSDLRDRASEQDADAPDGSGATTDDEASAVLGEPRGFETPSGNIACLAFESSHPLAGSGASDGPILQCEIGSGLQPPPADELCEFDWTGASMSATGAATPQCASDTMRGELGLGTNPDVLAYGTRWTAGPFTCMSQEAGLTCRNNAGGHMFLSRDRWEAS